MAIWAELVDITINKYCGVFFVIPIYFMHSFQNNFRALISLNTYYKKYIIKKYTLRRI